MPMQSAVINVSGVTPLLLANPQTVNRFNPIARRMAEINAKKTRRTDEDYLELRDLEIRAKTYFDDALKVYVPASWLLEAAACNGFQVAKLSRDKIRGALFATEDKIKLHHQRENVVLTLDDVIGNEAFHHIMGVPQGQVRVMKAWPIFHAWNFSTALEFDNTVMDPQSLTRILQHAGKYGGFGDFRPKFGRAVVEVNHV